AIQGLGVFPLDVRQAPVDFFAADGHKWLLGPEGAGIFFLREEHLNLLRPLNIGWNSVAHGNDFSRVELTLRQSASRYESGTQNMAGFIGLGGSLETLHKYGLGPTHSAIAERVLDLTDQLAERMLRADWRLGSDRTETAVKSGILAFEVPGVDSLGLKQQLHGERVVLSYRGGKLRLAVHAFNSEEDFDRLFSAVRKQTGKEPFRGRPRAAPARGTGLVSDQRTGRSECEKLRHAAALGFHSPQAGLNCSLALGGRNGSDFQRRCSLPNGDAHFSTAMLTSQRPC
ncbi:MAG: aminotransferase class V-fold PLP-dependent enzyme, partial [Planctomycetota bacterium]